MDQTAKQQAVEKLKQATNVLVTISKNPSVDELSAALGFTLLLSKLDKHATAVFSGEIPPAINFLEPNKTFEKNVNGLRDFIIALDKDKADKLRYKVENDVVRIFITPYRTALTKDDLRFEEGDYNVDAVVALGVGVREDLDNAIKAHGRILHDAAVIAVNAGPKSSNLGSIDWQDPSASSLCEMLVSISESFGSGLLDAQIATAFLTGIVAATERFSNNLTSPKVMTMAAQLMAAGANQQLIASNLNLDSTKAKDLLNNSPKPAEQASTQNEIKLEHNTQKGDAKNGADINPKTKAKAPEKTLKQLESEISHLASTPGNKPTASEPPVVSATPESKPLPPSQPQPQPQPQPPKTGTVQQAKQPSGLIGEAKGKGPKDGVGEGTTLGGTFNATTEQAHEEAEKDLFDGRNDTILTHSDSQSGTGSGSYINNSKPKVVQSLNLSQQQAPAEPTPVVGSPNSDVPQAQPSAESTIDVNLARKQVEEAINSQPFSPDNNPLSAINAQPLPVVDASTETPPQINIDAKGNVTPQNQVDSSNTERNLPPPTPPQPQ